MQFPDITPLLWFGVFGIVVAALAVVIGVPWLIWYLATHLAWIA